MSSSIIEKTIVEVSSSLALRDDAWMRKSPKSGLFSRLSDPTLECGSALYSLHDPACVLFEAHLSMHERVSNLKSGFRQRELYVR